MVHRNGTISFVARVDEIYRRLLSEGEPAIDALVADFQSENLWLDFKRSADDGKATKLNISDRENLARAISGFGNSDGGVILWGVDCRRDPRTGADLPGARHPIERPQRFVSWLEGAVSSCTAPAHASVEHHPIVSSGAPTGYVATLIPQSLEAPLQCIQPTDRLQYYMRAGSNFAAVPHAVLAGLFGRRPQARVAQKWFGSLVRVNSSSGLAALSLLSLSSTGRAIARDLYVNVYTYPPGPNCTVTLEGVDVVRWDRHDVTSNFWNLISRESVRVAPGAMIEVGAVSIQVNPPFTRPLTLEISYGCEGGERRQWRVDVPEDDIAHVCSRLHANEINGNDVLKVLFGAIE
jgi:hypothetical protein